MAHLLIWGKSSELLSSARPPRHAEEVQTFGALLASLDGKTAALILADPARIEAEKDSTERWLVAEGRKQAVLIAVSEPGDGDAVLERMPFVDDVVSRPVTPGRLERKIKGAFERIQHNRMLGQLRENLERKTADLKSLNDIGVALSAERDIDPLLGKILQKSRELTRADAGSLYIVPSDDANGREKNLWFKLAQNDSKDVNLEERSLPLDERSMAGYVALNKETLNIEDAYKIPGESPFQFSRSFDEASHWKSKRLP